VKAVSGRVECAARVVLLVGVVVGLILVVVWETVFTPAVHLADDSNSTVSETLCSMTTFTLIELIITQDTFSSFCE